MFTRCLTITLVCGAVAPAAAVAEPGVTVDLSSPAGQEYAVPLEAARDLGAGRAQVRTPGAAPGAPTSTPAPADDAASVPGLFGEGVEPPARAGRDAPGDGRAVGRRAPATGERDRAEAPGPSSTQDSTSPGAPQAPSAAAASMATSALGVLAAGLLLALGLQVTSRRLRGGGVAA